MTFDASGNPATRNRGAQLKTDYDTLLYEEEEGVAIVTMNRPEVHNSFNLAMQKELREVWQGLRWNEDVRVVVLTGAGEKAFCTGIDRQEAIEESYLEHKVLDRMRAGPVPVGQGFMYNDPGGYINPKANDMWKPVISAVNGMACGGALYMLGESDIIIAAEHATFFDPHVTYGMVAAFESLHLLQKLPLGETMRLALMGAHERMSAERAHQLGLVSEIVPAAELRERTMWVARAIASAPTNAIQGTVRAIWLAHELNRRDALAQVSSFIALGTKFENIAEGQETFKGERIEWRLR